MENESTSINPNPNDNQSQNAGGIQTLEDALAELEKVRNEAASRRIAAREATKELEEKTKRWEAYEESQKTELQKLQEALAEKDKQLSEYLLDRKRLEVLTEFGLDRDDLDFLTGSDEETIRKQAEKLKARNEKIKAASSSRPADLLAGSRGTPIGGANTEKSFDDFLRSLAKRQ